MTTVSGSLHCQVYDRLSLCSSLPHLLLVFLASSGSQGQHERHLRELRALPAVQSDASQNPLCDDLPGLLPDPSDHHLSVLLPHCPHANQECLQHAGGSQ